MMPEMWIKKIIRGNVVTVIFSFFRHTPPSAYALRPIAYSFSFASKPLFWHFWHCCIILLINYLYTPSIPIVQDSYKLPISSL